MGFYKLVKALEYETALPGAEATRDPEDFNEDAPVRHTTGLRGVQGTRDARIIAARGTGLQQPYDKTEVIV